jgi:hypothetical protein
MLILLAHSAIHASETDSVPFRKTVKLISERAISDDIYQFQMDGYAFRVPVRHLATILENSEAAPDELQSGFSFIGLWPGLTAKTRDNTRQFSERPSTSNLIRVFVNRNCTSVTVKPVRPQKCMPPDRMHSLYSHFGRISHRDFISASANDQRQGPISNIPGMTYEGFSLLTKSSFRPTEVYYLVYRGYDSGGGMEFATCTPQIKPYVHVCVMRIAWKDRFHLNIHIRGGLLPEWPAIRGAILAKLDSFVIGNDTPPPAGLVIEYFP